MSAKTREHISAENARRRVIASRKSAMPVYVREQLAGRWRLTADLDGTPLFLLLDLDFNFFRLGHFNNCGRIEAQRRDESCSIFFEIASCKRIFSNMRGPD